MTEELIKQHSVIVLTNTSLEEQKRVNAITHNNGKLKKTPSHTTLVG